jgi:hypothetical protein
MSEFLLRNIVAMRWPVPDEDSESTLWVLRSGPVQDFIPLAMRGLYCFVNVKYATEDEVKVSRMIYYLQVCMYVCTRV